MSDGRFEVDVDHLLRVWDTESNKRLTVEEVVDLLNEQQLHLIKSSYELCKKQIEIDKLKLRINELQQKIDVLCEDNDYGR